MIRPNVVILARPQLVVRLADELPDREPLRTFTLTGSTAQTLDRSVFADRLIILLSRDTQVLINLMTLTTLSKALPLLYLHREIDVSVNLGQQIMTDTEILSLPGLL